MNLDDAINDVHDSIYCLEAGDLFIVDEDGEPLDFAMQQAWARTLLGIVEGVRALQEENDRLYTQLNYSAERETKLQEQAARYREALEFYGGVASWEKTIHDQRTGYWYSKLSNDGGAIARAALAGSPDTGDQQ